MHQNAEKSSGWLVHTKAINAYKICVLLLCRQHSDHMGISTHGYGLQALGWQMSGD